MDSVQKRFIQEEIKRQINILLTGAAGETTATTETINSMFPGMPAITARPIMHPFGLASRATQGTPSVVGRGGDHFGARFTMGHLDPARPTDIGSGETVLYNEFGQRIYIRDGEIQIGSESSENPMVLGDILQDFIRDLWELIQGSPQVGWSVVGPVWLDPAIRAGVELLIQQYVEEASTNIVSQLTFTERGGG